MILSARYGLLDLDDRILRYETRLPSRWAITAAGLQEQAEQLGVLDTAEVIILAPAAYAALAAQVWPHALRPLAGTRGIGEQLARFAALATGNATVASLMAPAVEVVSAPVTAYLVGQGCQAQTPARRAAVSGPSRANRLGPSPRRPGHAERHARGALAGLAAADARRTRRRVAGGVPHRAGRGPPRCRGWSGRRVIHSCPPSLSTGRRSGLAPAHARRARWAQLPAWPPVPGRPHPREVGSGTQQRHRHSVGTGPTRAPGRSPRRRPGSEAA